MSDIQDILKYIPVSEPTGDVADFGMPSHEGNLLLTGFVTGSDSCLEATKKAMDLSFANSYHAHARTPYPLSIIRRFFGSETNQDGIDVYEPVFASHYINSFFEAQSILYGKGWEVVIDKPLPSIAMYLIKRELIKDSVNPTPQVLIGKIIDPGNWYYDGMPFIKLVWPLSTDNYCSDGTQLTQSLCEATVNTTIVGYFCENASGVRQKVGSMTYTGGQQVDMETYSYPVTGLPFRPLTATECTSGSGGSSGGRCYYSPPGNGGVNWYEYGSNNGQQWCEVNTINYAPWANYHWQWRAGGNTWGGPHHKWWPDAATAAAHTEFNIRVSDTVRHYPDIHTTMTEALSTNNNTLSQNEWYYFYNGMQGHYGNILNDQGVLNGGSPGNYQEGLSFGVKDNSIHTWYMTNTFEWDTNIPDTITPYYGCSDGVSGTEATCIATSTCSDGASPDEVTCTGLGYTWDIGVWGVTGDVTTWEKYANETTINDYETIGWPVAPHNNITGFPTHTFVDHDNSKVQSMYGFTANSNQTAAAHVRWLSPQNSTNIYDRAYPYPDAFRVYRSAYWRDGLQNPPDSDFQLGFYKLVNEEARSGTGYQHYYDPREEMLFDAGLKPFNHCYYSVTSVWYHWNWHRGLSISRHQCSNTQWDPASTNNNVSLQDINNYNIDSEYEHWNIHIDDNTSNRSLRIRGYFKAKATGNHQFHIRADDAMYVWLGNAGDNISTLEPTLTQGSAVVSAPGSHGDQVRNGTIALVEDETYPFIIYHGQGSGGMTCRFEFTLPDNTRHWDLSNYFYPDVGAQTQCSDGVSATEAVCESNGYTWWNLLVSGQEVVEGRYGPAYWSWYTN